MTRLSHEFDQLSNLLIAHARVSRKVTARVSRLRMHQSIKSLAHSAVGSRQERERRQERRPCLQVAVEDPKPDVRFDFDQRCQRAFRGTCVNAWSSATESADGKNVKERKRRKLERGDGHLRERL